MGTTAQKLTYLNETKTQIRKGLNNLGASLTTSDTFRSYANVLNDIYDYLPKVTGSGENVTLNDTAKGKMILELGATELSQAGTPTPSSPQDIHTISGDNSVKVTNKNFFNPNIVISSQLVTVSNNEITISDNSGWGQGHIICGDKLLPGTYVISAIGNISTIKLIVRGYKDGEIYTTPITGSDAYSSYYKAFVYGTAFQNYKTFTLPDTCDYYYAGFSLGRDGNETLKIQVESGSTATTYVPYTSQEADIDLGDLEVCKRGTYEDEFIKTTGKNLFDKNSNDWVNLVINSTTMAYSTTEYTNVRIYYIPCKPNTIYTYSKNLGNFMRFASSPNIPASGGAISVINNNTTGTSDTITTGANDNYIAIFPLRSSEVDTIGWDNVLATIQLEEGSVATDYEPYGSNEWYIKKNIVKFAINGTGYWGIAGEGDTTNGYSIYTNAIPNINSNSYQPVICDKFKYIPYNDLTSSSMNFVTTGYNDVLIINIDKTLLSEASVSVFKTWLGTNLPNLYYPVAIPTYTQITGTLAEQLETVYQKLLSYKGQTNISQVNNDLPFTISASALMDLTSLTIEEGE